MLIIGLDGATWSKINANLDELPNFKKLKEKYKHAVLECDVRPVHSAPSWTTIFTGVLPSEHGVLDFAIDEKQRSELENRSDFIWKIAKSAVVMPVAIAIPPIAYNFSLDKWESLVFSITSEEMNESTTYTLERTIELLQSKNRPELIVSIFYETDRAQHVYWHDEAKIVAHYANIDKALGKLMPFFEKENFLILSDHGFTNAQETKDNKWDTVRSNQTGGHHPSGIVISNLEPPRKVTQVYSFIKKELKMS